VGDPELAPSVVFCVLFCVGAFAVAALCELLVHRFGRRD
jgi:hypothetical protein